MFALPRRCARIPSLFSRGFAEIVPAERASEGLKAAESLPPSPNANETSKDDKTPKIISPVRLGNRVPVREDHGLYGFFRKKQQGEDGKTYVGEAQYETIGGSLYQERSQSGRSWKASELRLKSFQDLHTLWYVLLRERNLLATQKEEVRRIGAIPMLTSFRYKTMQVHKSMARIKYVMNERRLAYEGAIELAEQEKQDHLDEVVLQHQVAEYKKDRRRLALRAAREAREAKEKRKAAREAARAAAADSPPKAESDASAPSQAAAPEVASHTVTENKST
ncbi:54S ribosomal protein L4 mitochondrial [Paramarasmius palmivorus]|uniref:Large ribosomal subunit protein uL29m n=1 Tax=Paramarasmius palmivorus TaxID=297713 RepID=A0AAW0DYV4_9AGAR